MSLNFLNTELIVLLILRIALIVTFFTTPNSYASTSPPYRIIDTLPHDTIAFTQGLVHSKSLIYESSGLYGRSFIRLYDPNNGQVVSQKRIPNQYFAEGLEKVANQLFLLTWKEQTLFVFNAKTLKKQHTFSYQGEGWGLTHNGDEFIMSNGTPHLSFYNSKTFKKTKSISLKHVTTPPPKLNELEFAQGYIWANSWQQPYIYQIDPNTGEVVTTLDFSELVRKNSRSPQNDVLNGIAYDEEKRAFWITGKNWPNMYLIKVDSLK